MSDAIDCALLSSYAALKATISDVPWNILPSTTKSPFIDKSPSVAKVIPVEPYPPPTLIVPGAVSKLLLGLKWNWESISAARAPLILSTNKIGLFTFSVNKFVTVTVDARVAVSAFPVTSPVTSPVKSPVIVPVAVKSPFTYASPILATPNTPSATPPPSEVIASAEEIPTTPADISHLPEVPSIILPVTPLIIPPVPTSLASWLLTSPYMAGLPCITSVLVPKEILENIFVWVDW